MQKRKINFHLGEAFRIYSIHFLKLNKNFSVRLSTEQGIYICLKTLWLQKELICLSLDSFWICKMSKCVQSAEQRANHIASCPPYHSPKGTLGLAALDDDSVDWLQKTVLSI